MACARCVLAAKRELEEMNLRPVTIELGFAGFNNDLNNKPLKKITRRLANLGFEILHDKKSRMVEPIKTL